LTVAAGSVSDPPNGTATIVAGGIQYTPDANYSGPDSFTYRAFDGTASSNLATVNVTVNPVNDAPTVSVVMTAGTLCGTTGGTISLLLNDIDTAATSLTLSRTTSATKVLALANITFGGSGAA